MLFQYFLQYFYHVCIELFLCSRGDSLWETKLHWPRSCRSNIEESDTKWSVRKLLRHEREKADPNVYLLQRPYEIIPWNLRRYGQDCRTVFSDLRHIMHTGVQLCTFTKASIGRVKVAKALDILEYGSHSRGYTCWLFAP